MNTNFVFGAGYGDLFPNTLAARNADTNDYWHFADAQRQAQQDEFTQAVTQQRLQAEAQERARQMAQWNFTRDLETQKLGITRASEARQERGEAANEAMRGRTAKLAEDEFAWKKTQPTPTEERGSELLFKSAHELAQEGALRDEDVADLPDDHQTALLAINERAKKLIAGQKSKIDDAASTLNRVIALEHQLKQTGEDLPGVIHSYAAGLFSQPGKRKRMLEGQAQMQEELKSANEAKSAVTPELKSHLRMNEHGWWEPNFELPWAAGAAPVVTATGTGASQALTPELAQRFLQQAGGNKDAARQMARQAGYSF